MLPQKKCVCVEWEGLNLCFSNLSTPSLRTSQTCKKGVLKIKSIRYIKSNFHHSYSIGMNLITDNVVVAMRKMYNVQTDNECTYLPQLSLVIRDMDVRDKRV